MTVLHVREPGAVIRRDAERLHVTRRDPATRKTQVLTTMPVREIEQVTVYGNVQLTTQAIDLLLRNNIEVVYLSSSGGYRGCLRRDGSQYARLRHQQLLRAGKPREALAIAIPIVQAKLAGQRAVLNALAAQVEQKLVHSLERAASSVNGMRRSAAKAGTLDALRGYEGKGSAFYFDAIKSVLDPAWSFQNRQYHPPPDPFNALLSFGYALLQRDIETVAQRVGLDPYIGCLHALEYGRPSLVLDLMEEFRPLVVDHATLHLALGRKLGPSDFTFTNRADRPVELGAALIPLVLDAYEQRANDTIRHRPSDTEQRLRLCFELQARIYARTIMGERAQYEGIAG